MGTRGPIASNVTTLENEIPCDTVGGEVGIKNRGDLRVDGLEVDQGLMAPWSTMTLISLTQKLHFEQSVHNQNYYSEFLHL